MVRSFHGTLVPGYYVSPSAYEHYLRAQLLSNDGRAEEAADQLRQAIACDGASAYLRTRLAEELLTLGRIDEAREEIEAALHLDGQFAEAYVDLARVQAAARRRRRRGGGAQARHRRRSHLRRRVRAPGEPVSRARAGGEASQETWRELAQARAGVGGRRIMRWRARPWRAASGRRPRPSYLRALDLDGNLERSARRAGRAATSAEGASPDAVATLARGLRSLR